MKDNAYDRKVRGRKRGKLDMRSLYKVPAKVENIFTLKEARKNKHYNVILLVDQSGSMFGPGHDLHQQVLRRYQRGEINDRQAHDLINDQSKRLINIAADCAAFLAKSLDRVDVKYGVIGYDSDWRWHKKLLQPATDDKIKKIKYDLIHTGGGGTQLLEPMKAAFNELRKTPEHKNIVICISDGSPSGPDNVKHFVYGNQHVAEFVDVGIAYKPVMPNGFTVNNVEELKPLLIQQLKKRIKRG